MANRADDIEAARKNSLLVSGERPTSAEDTPVSAAGLALQSETLAVLDERMSVSKRRLKTGSVRVSTRTETHEELAELALERCDVEITRVPIDRIVDEAPPVRTDGATTIVPILQERLVVVKQLVLIEEVHIRRRIDHEIQRTPVVLRTQHAEVTRFDADGHVTSDVRSV